MRKGKTEIEKLLLAHYLLLLGMSYLMVRGFVSSRLSGNSLPDICYSGNPSEKDIWKIYWRKKIKIIILKIN